MRSRELGLLLLAFALAGCGQDAAGAADTGVDSGDMTPDAGTAGPEPDAAGTTDTGRPPDMMSAEDAGTEPDAGPGDTEVEFQTSTLVDTSSGELQGFDEDGLRVFLGVPFAEPPVGDLRFRAPVPVSDWADVQDASEYGPACIQEPLLGIAPNGTSEDCLTLNVWSPASDEPLPVMVWIHGGGFINGSGGDALYEGANLAASQDVVVISINYRLGPLGYLALPELQAEDPNGSTGNYGGLDQLLALQWIRENAPAFGGDANNITIFGESAGAFSVCALVGSPLADDAFDKAIMQSGGCNGSLDLQTAQFGPSALESGARVLDDLGCADAPDILACLRAVDVADLGVDASTLGSLVGAEVAYSPVIDGYFLEELPFDRITDGRAPNRPMIIGSNGNEGALFTAQDVILTRFDLRSNFEDLGLGDDAVDELMDTYDAFTFPIPKSAWEAFFGELFFNCSSWFSAVDAPFPTYAYHLMVGPAAFSTLAGPLHAAEIPYVFGNFAALAIIPSLLDLDMSDRLQAAWASFARTGVPDHEPTWPAIAPDNTQFMEWGLLPSVETEFRGDRCAVLRGLGLTP